MLTAIRVGNFKAFAETQKIPLRPLTLIYGANSSGKSNIIHSLILAHQSMQMGNLTARWCEAHIKELLAEMYQQVKAINTN